MKRKKIITAIAAAALSALLCATVLPLTALATDAEYTDAVTEDTPDTLPDPTADDEGEATEALPPPATEAEDEATEADEAENEATEADGSGSFLTRVGEELRSYLGEIFSALALVGSVILAIAYRRGLLPTVTKSLSATYGAVKSIKESTDKSGNDTRVLGESITARLDTAEQVISDLSAGIAELNTALAAREESATEREKTRIIFLAQVDMLYEVFMSSSLPQYEKDAIAERVKAMKSALEVKTDE